MLILQRNFTRLHNEHDELEEMLLEEKTQKEKFKNMKNNIEDERRLLDCTVEKLQKEVSVLKCGGQVHPSHTILIKFLFPVLGK